MTPLRGLSKVIKPIVSQASSAQGFTDASKSVKACCLYAVYTKWVPNNCS